MGDGVPDQRAFAGPATSPPSARSLSPDKPSIPSSPCGGESSSLAAMLCPVLRQICDGRLSAVQWFRSAWQAGGASTGTATYQVTPSRAVEVVVKLPVGPREYEWTTGAGRCAPDTEDHHGPTPRVLAAGTELGGYDLAWLVVEKLDGQPVSAMLSKDTIEGLLQAAADWYCAASSLRELDKAGPPPTEDWMGLIAKGRAAVRNNAIPNEQRWNEALKQTQRILPRLLAIWQARSINAWCHGDLHPGNAMMRRLPHRSPSCVLIDLALVHAGHWIEDALYLERLFWAKPELLFGVKVVATLARFRRERGLETSDDYGAVAQIRRILMAATVPAFLEHEGHPKYVHAALETLERTLPNVAH